MKPRIVIAAIALILLAVAAFIATKSSITGLAVIEDSELINSSFNESSLLLLSLSGSPVQVSISGAASGKFEIRIDGMDFYSGDSSGEFVHAVNYTSLSENITIEIKLDNSTLTLDKLDYIYQTRAEEPVPYWNSSNATFYVMQDSVLEIDLDDYFVDDDNLTYLASGASNLSVGVDNSLLRVVPDAGFFGERRISVIASDETSIVRQELRIVVEANITESAEANITPEINITANITANITENITINITANVTGNITSGVTANITALQYSENEKIEVNNKTLGKKTQDDAGYEVYFALLNRTNESFIIEFYHDFSIPLPVFVEGNVSYNLSFAGLNDSLLPPNETARLEVLLVEGIIPAFELHVGIGSEVFSFGKKIPSVKKKKGQYKLIDRDDEFLDVEVYTNSTRIVISRTNASSINSTIDYVSDAFIKTEVAALDSVSMSNATVQLRKNSRINAVLKCSDIDMETLECYSGWSDSGIPFADDGENVTFVVDSFSGYAGGYIEVLNVYSYPVLYGNWTVVFNTTGTANLSVSAVNGTTWTNNVSCYDAETEVLTEEGWKLFDEIGDERVMTLNPKTLEKEWQRPTAKQEYDYRGEMYRVITEKGDLLVSPEHKVYAAQENKDFGLLPVCLIMMEKPVKNNNIFFGFKEKNKASYMNSLMPARIMPEILEMHYCGFIEPGNLANLGLNSQKQSSIFMLEFSKEAVKLGSVNLHKEVHQLLNSSGVIGFFLPDFSSLEVCSIDAITSFATDSLTSLLSSSEISEIARILFFNSSSFTSFNVSANARLATEDQLTQSVLDISSFNLSGRDNVIVPILDLQNNYVYYVYTKDIFKGFGSNQESSLINSAVVKTKTSDCFFKCASLDQTGQFSLKASAMKSTSSISDNDLDASDKNELYFSSGINLINLASSSSRLLNSFSEQPVFAEISDKCPLVSCRANSGEYNSSFCSLIISLAAENFQKNANKTLLSTTNFTYINPLARSFLNRPFLTFLPISTHHSSNCLSCFNFSNIFSFQDSSSVFSIIDFLINPDQFISENSSILCLTSSGTDNVMLTIFNTSDYVKKHKDVEIYKGFGLNQESSAVEPSQSSFAANGFKLMPVAEAYSKFNENLKFIDSSGQEIKIKSITKEKYSGKIFDVDVSNDVVLVRRDGLITWSGNSDSADLQFLDLKCGNSSVNYSWINNSVFVLGYNCSSLGYLTSKELRAGKHTLEFRFGNSTAYAFNDVIPEENFTAGLVGHWACEGDFKDSSGQANHGTQSGGVKIDRGVKGRACGFDGVDSLINISDTNNLDMNRTTVCAWVNRAGGTGEQLIASKGFYGDGATSTYAWTLYIYAGGSDIRFYTDTNVVNYSNFGTNFATNFAFGTWHHLCGTYNGTHSQVYFDGVSGTAKEDPNGLVVNNKPVIIGSRVTVGAYYFNGSIDEVRIYNRSLSATEVAELYNTSRSYYVSIKTTPTKGLLDETELVGYWKMDREDGSNSTRAIDSSGLGNNGTVLGGAIFTNEGRFKEGYKFDGVDDYIVTAVNPSSLNIIGNLSLSFWVKRMSDWDYYDGFIEKRTSNSGAPYCIYAYGSGDDIQFGYSNGTGWGTAVNVLNIPLNQWTHVAFVRNMDNQQTYSYKNGVLQATVATHGQAIATNTEALRIGYGAAAATGALNNSILDEVRIYNRSLSASEVAALYNGTKSNKIVIKTTPTKGLLNDTPAPTASDETGLVGWWKMDDLTNGNTTDSSGQGNNGSVIGAAFNSGRWNSAYGFDGVNDYVNVSDASSLTLSNTSTFSVWVKPEATTTQYVLQKGVFQQDGYLLNLYLGTAVDFYTSQAGAYQRNFIPASGSGIVINKWNHIVVSMNGNASIYVNGIMRTPTISQIHLNPADGTTWLSIGSTTPTPGSFFNGSIDEVRIYNRSLSANEVKELYLSKGLVGHWKMDADQKNSTSTFDTSGYYNHGTVSGATFTNEGRFKEGYKFDGVNDYINAGSGTSLRDQNFTISTWIKFNALDSQDNFINNQGSVFYQLGSTLLLYANSGNRITSGTIATNTWYNAVVTYDHTNMKIYLNGVQNVSQAYSSDITYSGNTLIGGTGVADYAFNGSIDEVRIYNRALTASEVAGLYNGTKSNYISFGRRII